MLDSFADSADGGIGRWRVIEIESTIMHQLCSLISDIPNQETTGSSLNTKKLPLEGLISKSTK